jgi:hypothetical protein
MKTLFWRIICFFHGHDFVYDFEGPIAGSDATAFICKRCGRSENQDR